MNFVSQSAFSQTLTDNEKTNNSIVLNEALINKNYETVASYLNRQDEIKLDFVDPDNGYNLFFNLLVFLKPSSFDRENDLDSDWKNFVLEFLKDKKNYEFVQKQGDKDNLFTVLGKNSSLWLAQTIIDEIKKSDEKFINDHLSYQNEEGSTALHFSLQAVNTKLSEYLIDLKIDLNKQDQVGIFPLYLHVANYFRFLDLQKEDEWNLLFEKMLGDTKLDLKLNLDPNRYYPTVMLMAASLGNIEILKKLQSAGANLFAVYSLPEDGASRNSLTVAIENSREDLVKYLFDELEKIKIVTEPKYRGRAHSRTPSGPTTNYLRVLQAKNHKGENLLHLAAKHEFLFPIEYLSQESMKDFVDVNLENLDGKKPIDFSFSRVRKPVIIIDALVAHPNINLGLPLANGKDLFTNLTQFEVVNAIKTYLEKFEPDWNRLDQNDNPVYLKLLSLRNYDIYQSVMQSFEKLDLSLVDSSGANITHYLVFYGGAREHLNKIYSLRPQLFKQVDRIGQNTLFRAAVAHNQLVYADRSEVENPVSILLDLNIDYDLSKTESQKKKNLAHIAVANQNSLLVEHLLKVQPELFTIEDEDKATALHFAASYGNSTIVRKILSIPNVNFDVQDELRRYPIHHAFESGDIDTIELFIEREIQLDVVSAQGETVIELLLQDIDWQDAVETYVSKVPAAAFDGLVKSLEIEDYWYVQYFIEQGANINQKIERGAYNGLYPIMVPIVNRSEDMLNFLVTGYDPEVPDEPANRGDIDLNVVDSNGRTIIAHAIEAQNIKVLKLIKEWDIDFNKGTAVQEGRYISHNLLFAANYFDWNVGSEEELEKSQEFVRELLSFPGLNKDIQNREGQHWILSALKSNNGFVVAEAIRKWPEIINVEFNEERAIDFVIKGRHWGVVTSGIPFGFTFNTSYSYRQRETIQKLKNIFNYWGYSDSEPYYELIHLGMDTDTVLEAIDGLFERDELLLNIELYIDRYLRHCKRVHREKNQEHRINKEDHRIYPFLNNPGACIAPDVWEQISDKPSFHSSQSKL